MKSLALAVPAVFLLTTCAAYQAQHRSPSMQSSAAAQSATSAPSEASSPAATSAEPLDIRLAALNSEVEKYMDDLKANGKYDCCIKPACRQCALSAGECHCRQVIDANGPCCGECTQAWVDGRGVAEGVDREKVLAHLGCVRELYEKKTPEGMTPPGQRKP